MRLLADENFPKPTVDLLRSGGHDVLWARTDCRGWKDAALLELAESEGRIMLTLDKDFWQISVQRPIPLQRSGVVLFRHHPATPENLEGLIRTFAIAGKEWAGHISIVTAGGIQMLSSRKT
jgi:predicted nuclease of predicted toxin-antitoxin system